MICHPPFALVNTPLAWHFEFLAHFVMVGKASPEAALQ
jgi:hypothetical protein